MRGSDSLRAPEDHARAYSVIVPVHNEAARLPETVACLWRGLAADAEVIFVCNGCTDESAAIIRRLVDHRARIIELAAAGKARAIRAGEAQATLFPRFFVDSDVLIEGRGLTALASELVVGRFELMSPRLKIDLAGCGTVMRKLHGIMRDLPHMQGDAFHQVLGLSRAGRHRFGPFPDVMADDSFIEAQIPLHRKRIAQSVTAIYRPPRTLGSMIAVRARWIKGQRQLERLGHVVPRSPGQRRALMRLLLRPGRALAALLYGAVWLAAQSLARSAGANGWYRDQTSRRPGD